MLKHSVGEWQDLLPFHRPRIFPLFAVFPVWSGTRARILAISEGFGVWYTSVCR